MLDVYRSLAFCNTRLYTQYDIENGNPCTDDIEYIYNDAVPAATLISFPFTHAHVI